MLYLEGMGYLLDVYDQDGTSASKITRQAKRLLKCVGNVLSHRFRFSLAINKNKLHGLTRLIKWSSAWDQAMFTDNKSNELWSCRMSRY